jgi:hypothetical protein
MTVGRWRYHNRYTPSGNDRLVVAAAKGTTKVFVIAGDANHGTVFRSGELAVHVVDVRLQIKLLQLLILNS